MSTQEMSTQTQTYETVAQTAARIRAELKAMGYGRAEVSVRSSNYPPRSAVDITVKAIEVDIAAVRKVAAQAERASRVTCLVSGQV